MEGGRVSGLGGRHARRPIGLVYSPQDGSAGSARLGLGLIYGKAPCRRSEINGGRQQDLSKAGRTADRKSTRLNSSHSQISYAVFCLKKKKKAKYNTTNGVNIQHKWQHVA